MITAKDIYKTYVSSKGIETKVLKGISFDLKDGEFVAIMGRSGAGKSTLLYQLSLLDRPTSGKVMFDGVETSTLSNKERVQLRLNRMGYIFQDYALIPELTAVENVMLPLIMRGDSKADARRKALTSLEEVGLGHRPDNLPSQLSGGEQQRVSVSRAIAHNPDILFADEPTANLDAESAKTVLDLLSKLHKEKGQTIAMVTHEEEYSKIAERLIYLSHGKIEERSIPDLQVPENTPPYQQPYSSPNASQTPREQL